MTVELEIKNKHILKEVLAFASQRKINSRVFEDDEYEVFPERNIISAEELGERLDNAILEEGMSMEEFKKQMESWR
jgi:hypothetical protein